MKWRRASRRSELSAALRRDARPVIAAFAAAAVATLGSLGARRLVRARAARAGDRRPPEPLGPEAKMFRGSTPPQNTLAGPLPPGFKRPAGPPPHGEQGLPRLAGAQSSDVEVLVLLVDTNDHRYTGTAADLSTYRDAKHAALSTQLGPYWMEASFGAVDVRLDMRAEMLSLPGAFDDYFNRGFVAASLESRGLAAAGWPRTYDGTPRATLHVRDVHKRDVDVVLAPNGTFADAAQLAANLQTGIDAITSVPADWLTCTASAGDLRFELPQHEVGEASFIRVRAPDASLGLDGPLETPGDTATVASLTGKPVPGGFPLALDGSEFVEIEVRDKDLRTRRYSVALPAGSVGSPADLAALLLPSINSELNWAEAFDAGPDRLGLRLLGALLRAQRRDPQGRQDAGSRKLGLFGFLREDGVIDFDGRLTVRGDAVATTEQALSLHFARRAADAGIPITATRLADLRALVTSELATYESFLVLFVEATTGIPGRRAGAASSGYFNLEVPGRSGFTFQHQVSAGHMLGTGAETWQTWAHELGHVLGFWDLYAQSYHDAHFDRGFDYVREWELMDAHWAGAHVSAWHKLKRGWVTSVDRDLGAGSGRHRHPPLHPGPDRVPALRLLRCGLRHPSAASPRAHPPQPAPLAHRREPPARAGLLPGASGRHRRHVPSGGGPGARRGVCHRHRRSLQAGALPRGRDDAQPAWGRDRPRDEPGRLARPLDDLPGLRRHRRARRRDRPECGRATGGATGRGRVGAGRLRRAVDPRLGGADRIRDARHLDRLGRQRRRELHRHRPAGRNRRRHALAPRRLGQQPHQGARAQRRHDRRQGRRDPRARQHADGDGRPRDVRTAGRLAARGHPGEELARLRLRLATARARPHVPARRGLHARFDARRPRPDQQRRPGERRRLPPHRRQPVRPLRLQL